MSKGEILDHVQPRDSLPQQEERDLQQLQTQGEQAAEQDLRRCSLFFSLFLFVPCFVMVLLNLLLICPLVDGERGGRVEFCFWYGNWDCHFFVLTMYTMPDDFGNTTHMKQPVA